MDQNTVVETVRAVAAKMLGRHVRRYKYAHFNGKPGENRLGYSVDRKPVEGRVVYVSPELVVVRHGAKAEFSAIDTCLLPAEMTLVEGDKVRVRPYARRRFDGTYLYEPVKNKDGSYTFCIGDNKSTLPIDKTTIQSEYLLNLMDLLERGKSSSYRTIAQVLIDAGACLEPVQYNDPDEETLVKYPPALTFRIESRKLSGYHTVFYDRGADYYGVKILDSCGTIIDTVDDVDFSALAEVIEDFVDDGTWMIAHIEILGKPGKNRKAG